MPSALPSGPIWKVRSLILGNGQGDGRSGIPGEGGGEMLLAFMATFALLFPHKQLELRVKDMAPVIEEGEGLPMIDSREFPIRFGQRVRYRGFQPSCHNRKVGFKPVRTAGSCFCRLFPGGVLDKQ